MHRPHPLDTGAMAPLRMGAALLAVTLAACSAPPRKPAPIPAPVETQSSAPTAATLAAYQSAWEELGRLVKARQFDEARRLVGRQIGRSDFNTMAGTVQHRWLQEAGLLDIDAGAFEEAHVIFRLTSEMPEANEQDWNFRFLSAQRAGARSDAMVALTTIAQRWPERIRSYDPRGINRLLFAPRESGANEDARFQLLAALYALQWKLDYGFEPSRAWVDFARLLLERGDVDRAMAVAARITDPRALLALKVDKRFDAVVQAAPAHFDVDAAVAKQIALLEKLSADAPRKLALKYELIFAYLDAAQYGRALRIADAVLAAPSPKSAYDDYEEEINWILDARADALQGLGRWQDAQRYLEQAAARLENGQPNISNAINLAVLHARLGHSRAALTALGSMAFESEGVSPYGGMQIHHVMLLAGVASHDVAAVKDSLEFMRDNQSASPATFQSALLSANEIDEAASLLVHRLKDPALRSDALSDMQDYRTGALTPADRTVLQRWQRVKARNDVQAALAEVGRVERFSLAPEFR